MLFILPCVGWLLLCGLARPVIAQPYTVRNVQHPYDADWPDIYMLFATKCVKCHRAGTDQFELTSYEAILAAESNDEPVIIPGDPDASTLWQQVSWDDGVEAIHPPEPEERLTKGQLAIVRRWIENGARQFKPTKSKLCRPLLEMDFPSARECKICHPKQYAEWSRSMHAYAQQSPVNQALTLTMLERTSGTVGTFCGRCHTPLGTALGEEASRLNIHRSRLSLEGITCVACHRMSRPYYKSNTRNAIEPGKLLEQCMFGPFSDPTTDVDTHPSGERGFLKTSAFCGSCHDVTNPRGLRLEEAFSEWQNSPAAEQGITCQHCHMGPIQGLPFRDHERPLGRAAVVPGVDPERLPLRHLSDHTFAGPDYSLLPDTEFPEKRDWMYEIDYRNFEDLSEYHRESLKTLRLSNRRQLRIADQKRLELLSNAAKMCVTAPHTAVAGKRIKVRADVTSTISGHSFPTGFSQERQAWVEITLFDPCGRAIFRSGDLDSNGDLREEHSHDVHLGKIPFDRQLLIFRTKFVGLTHRGTERPMVLPVNRHLAPLNIVRPAIDIAASNGRAGAVRISRGLLPPLGTMGRTYSIPLPEQPGNYYLKVRLNFRNLPPLFLDAVGVPQLKRQLETVVLDEHDAIIQVKPSVARIGHHGTHR